MQEGQEIIFRIGRHTTVGVLSMVSADGQRLLVEVPSLSSEPVFEVVYADEVVSVG